MEAGFWFWEKGIPADRPVQYSESDLEYLLSKAKKAWPKEKNRFRIEEQ